MTLPLESGRDRGAVRLPASRASLILAAGLVVVAVLRPPELHPGAAAACGLIAAASLWFTTMSPAVSRLPAWIAGFTPFALVAFLGAANRATALDETALLITLLIAAGCGRAAGRQAGHRESLLRLLVVLGSVVAIQALWQSLISYPRMAAAVRGIDPADPSGILVRLESGRAAGPFLLPAALGGFLALALPAALRGLRAWRGVWRAAAGVATILIGCGFVLGRSMGAIVAAAAGLLPLLPLLAPRRRARAAWVAGGVAIAIIAVFAATRIDEIRDPAGDPFGLRAGNWRVAAAMMRDAPWFGSGPGSFGSFYPRHLRPGLNESRHAHNSYLELAAGWGSWILLPIALLIAAWVARMRSAWLDPGDGTASVFLGAGTAFLTHNLVDFTMFLPGVAIPAALILGAAFGATDPAPERRAGHPGILPGSLLRAGGIVVAVALALHGVTAARSRHLLDRAVDVARRGDLAAADQAAGAAAKLRPEDPAPRAFLAQMVLAEKPGKASAAAGAVAAAEAVARDPDSAILHYTRALYHRAAEESAAAYRELSEARRLNPTKALYRAAEDDPPSAGPPPPGGPGE